MRKFLLLLPIAFFIQANAQQNVNVQAILKKKNQEFERQIKEYNTKKNNVSITLETQKKLQELNSNLSLKEILAQINNNKPITGFVGNVPISYQEFDIKANKAANIDYLYTGSIEGQNVPIPGNINVTVIDGGTILDHVEFGTNRINAVDYLDPLIQDTLTSINYASHATNVFGVIGASGIDQNARGILTNNKVNSYGFYSTKNFGSNFDKILGSEYKLSNNSYGNILAYYPRSNYQYYNGILTHPLPIEYVADNTKTYSGTYYEEDYIYDLIAFFIPEHIIVKSAGNSFGFNKNNSTAIPPRYFVSSDINGQQYIKSIGSVNDENTIRLADLPDGNCNGNKACIDFGSLAKNIITVGAIEQFSNQNDNRYSGASNVQYASYSSAGPRKDGAIKPDITTVGSNVYVPTIDINGNYSIKNLYENNSGTSFSAPLVTGVIGALTEFQRIISQDDTFTFKADGIKNLITHTAQEAGLFPGPDVIGGWGVIDGKTAAELLIDISNNDALYENIAFNVGDRKEYEVIANGSTPLKASITWLDVPANYDTSGYANVFEYLANDTSNKLILDFDLRVIDTETNDIYYPWKLDINNPRAAALKGDNNVDNVEQILVESPVAGRKYRIEITKKVDPINDPDIQEALNINLIVSGIGNSLNTTEVGTETVKVFPTKTKDFVQINDLKGKYTIEVYNIAGQKVNSFEKENNSKIDLSHLGKGVYILNINTNQGVITKKILKY